MSSPILRSSFQSDLLPIINDWYGDHYKMQEELAPKICEVRASEGAFEVDGVLMGMSTMVKKGESQTLEYDTSRQLYTPRFTHDTWALGFQISMEALQDGKVMKDGRRGAEMLAKAKVETDNILAANLLNNAFTSSKTQDGGDTACLITASHPSPVGNLSNVLTVNAALSEASLESLYIQIRNAVDDRNIRINLKPRKLVVNPNLEPQANRILNSNLRVATTNNDLNFIKESGMFPEGILSTPYITSTTAFFVLTDAMDSLVFYKRYDSEVESDNIFDTKNAAYSLITRRSVGWINYRGIYGAQGA